jgi:ketosteroid isomerase-like protein
VATSGQLAAHQQIPYHGPIGGQTMSIAVAPEVTVQTLERFGEAWNRHDVDAIMSFMDADCAFETTAGPEPCGKRYEGRERVRQAFERVFAMFPDARFGAARHFVAGDRGLSEWRFTGTRDGVKVEVDGCDVFTFRNGRIAVKSSFFKQRTA